jgi:hypothetical protein
MRSAFRSAGLSIVALLLASFVSACGGGGYSSGSSVPAVPGPLSVNIKSAWTDTGRSVTAGQSVTISASGTINTGHCFAASCNSTPNGATWATCATDPAPALIAPGLACWSLVGKIGTPGTPFQLGTSAKFTAPTTGELFVGLNNNFFSDNTGSWVVTNHDVGSFT